VKKLWRYVKPFSYNTSVLRTDGWSDRMLYQYRASVCWCVIKTNKRVIKPHQCSFLAKILDEFMTGSVDHPHLGDKIIQVVYHSRFVTDRQTIAVPYSIYRACTQCVMRNAVLHCLSVRPSVRHTRELCHNGSTNRARFLFGCYTIDIPDCVYKGFESSQN